MQVDCQRGHHLSPQQLTLAAVPGGDPVEQSGNRDFPATDLAYPT